jgi:molybdopterin-guanine dinucleotide biosynthesis protein A
MPEADGLSAIILVGGRSRRLGRDKASEMVAGRSLLQRVVDAVSPLAQEIVLVGGRGGSVPGGRQAFPPVECDLPLKRVEDVREGAGALGGLYSGLLAAEHSVVVALACDMPLINEPLLRYLRSLLTDEYDVVMPLWNDREEPLHASYRRTCLPAIERLLDRVGRRFVDFLPEVRVRYVSQEEVARFDPEGRSFWNVNDEADLRRLSALLSGKAEEGG